MSKLTEREKAIIFSQRALVSKKKDGEINVIVHSRIHENDAETFIDEMIKFAEQTQIQSN